MLKNNFLVLLFLAVMVLVSCSKNSELIPNTENSIGTSGKAIDKLAKGINLTNWFNDYSDRNQLGTRYTTAHFNQIKNAGFTYVRLPIGPLMISDANNISSINSTSLTLLDQAVKNITSSGLSVALDFHAYTPNFESNLATNPLARVAFRQFWKSLSTYFSKYDTTQVFFEIFNEPHVGAAQSVAGIDKNWWAPFQGQVIQSIREATPNHYIIAGAENWNSWYDLSSMKVYSNKNIIYNFHLYEPYIFTHQGASWAGNPYDKLKSLPYPGSPQNVLSLAASAPNSEIKYLINWYGIQQYNADSLNYAVKQVYNWGNQNKVPVICNEFGVYKVFAPADSRTRYLQDMRNMLTKYKMGWAVWDYDENFGLSSYPNNNRSGIPVWDSNVLTALGLK